LNDLNQYQDALIFLQHATSIGPAYPETWSNLGISLNNLGLHSGAIDAYGEALKMNPQASDVWINRAGAFSRLGQYENALDSCEHSIALDYNQPKAWLSKAYALENLQRYDEALMACKEVLKLNGNSLAEAWFSIGGILGRLRRYDESLSAYEKAIELRPDYAQAWNDRGCILQELFQIPHALNCYQRAVSINPHYIDAIYNQGTAFYELLHTKEARESYQSILALEPNNLQAQLALTLSVIPVILPAKNNIQELRHQLSTALDDFDRWIIKNVTFITAPNIGSNQLFYLAYQELNNRELLSKYGNICCKLMITWLNGSALKPIPCLSRSKNKIKVGIISGHIRNHSVWHALIKGWVDHLDSEKFELHIFYLNSMVDSETEHARTKVASFTQHQEKLEDWIESIKEKAVDVLIYPEIGMNERTTQLASLKLAPIQLASWGHPETTGLPTIDGYISANAFEPINSENHYSEKLIKLPNLGCHYTKKLVVPEPINLRSLGLRESTVLLLCPGTPFKYSPSKDWVLVEIAKSLGNCQFIFFIDDKKWFSKALEQRLQEAFSSSGLNAKDYLKFIPWQSPEKFYWLMKNVDIFLDTIGFSGFNTAMQAIECDLPIVSQDGLFMRGRLATGILRAMSLEELIAANEQEYISLVIRLAINAEFNKKIREKIYKNKYLLFEDHEPIKALENHLMSMVDTLCDSKISHHKPANSKD